MIVYRIQHPATGLGPYQLKAVGPRMDIDKYLLWRKDWERMKKCHGSDGYHLDPHEDGLMRRDNHMSACLTLPQLETWFEGWIDCLVDEYGFEIVEIDVSQRFISVGTRQVIYLDSKVQKVVVIRKPKVIIEYCDYEEWD